MIRNAIAEEPLPVYGDGQNCREWLYIDDACRALHAILEQGSSTVYNVGGGTEKTNLEVVKTIVDCLDRSRDLIEFVEDRPGHDFRYALEYARLQSDTDWEPSVSFEAGLDRTIEWFS
jgi:dTDP-glucose 4,6-dehydratase